MDAPTRLADLLALSDRQLLRLDRDLRVQWGFTYEMAHSRWEDERCQLYVSASSRSGYQREAAVRAMAAIHDGTELPFLLLRCNDWVPQVQVPAVGAVRQRLTRDRARFFFRHMTLVEALGEYRRNRLDDLLDEIHALLATSPEAAEEALATRDRDTRAEVLSFLRTRQAALPVLGRAARDRDPGIRAWAARHLQKLDGDDAVDLLASLRADPSPTVRREVLYGLCRRHPARVLADGERWVLDRAAAVRELARTWLKPRLEVDFADFYRQRLEDARRALPAPLGVAIAGLTETGTAEDAPRRTLTAPLGVAIAGLSETGTAEDAPRRTLAAPLGVAIAGLSETGTAEDARLVEPYARNGPAGLQRAAVRALARLDAASHGPLFLDLLTSTLPGVSREAADALRRVRWAAAPSTLWTAAATCGLRHAKCNVLRLMPGYSKWDTLPCLLAATRDPHVADQARVRLEAWLFRFNREFTESSAEQRASARVALQEAEISDETRAQIGWILA